MDISCTDQDLIQIDEERLNQLIELSKIHYPDIDPYFIHMVRVEQLMYENGHEIDRELANEMYNKAQEQMKNKEFYFKVE